MAGVFRRLRDRIGGFWWHTLVLFAACRAADAVNAVTGMWLVPSRVDPQDLGAVLPLVNFANLLAVPAAAFANTFRSEASRLSSAGEFGRLKTLMRGVFVASAVFLFAAIVAARFAMPAFLVRIRIAEGSLAFLIAVSSLLGLMVPVFTSPLQALGKFGANSVVNILAAPVRFGAMAATMPFRALSGYFAGQSATSAFCIVASAFSLRKELSYRAEPYWTSDTARRMSGTFAVFLVWAVSGALAGVVETTVLRQDLSGLDSAGFYMAQRFAEISSYLQFTLAFTIFPYAAGVSNRGGDVRPLVAKAFAASAAFGLLVALPFLFAGRQILSMLPHGGEYSAYWWCVPWLVGANVFSGLVNLHATSQMAARRFSFLKWLVPLELAYAASLGFLGNVRSLSGMLTWMTAFQAAKATAAAIELACGRRKG